MEQSLPVIKEKIFCDDQIGRASPACLVLGLEFTQSFVPCLSPSLPLSKCYRAHLKEAMANKKDPNFGVHKFVFLSRSMKLKVNWGAPGTSAISARRSL